MKQKLPSIKRRFILIFTILLIFVSMVGLYASHRIAGSFREDISRRSLAYARSISDRIEAYLGIHTHVLSETKKTIESIVYETETVQDEIKRLKRYHPIFESLIVLDDQGFVRNIEPYNDDYIGIDFSKQPFFQGAMAQPFHEFFWSDSFISTHSGHPSVMLSLPLGSGVLTASLNLNTLCEVTQIPTAEQEGFVILTDRKGFILAHPDRNLIYQRRNISNLDSVRMGLEGGEGNRKERWMGQRGWASYHPIPDSGWLVLVFQTDKEAFGNVNRVYRTVQLVIILSFLFALFTFYLVQRRGQSSLRVLETQTKLIAAGMDGYTLEPEYSEFSGIMESFNDMSRTIRSKEAYAKTGEEQFRSLFEEAGDAILIVTPEGRIVEVNRMACEMHGYSMPEMKNLHLWEIETELSRDEIRKLWAQIPEDRAVTVTSFHRRKDNTIFPVEKRLSRIQIKNTPLFLGFMRDITERIETEKELRESEERYRLLAENVSDVIWTLDLNLQRTYISPSIQRLRGFTQKETLKRSLQEELTPESYILVKKILDEEMRVEREGTGDPERSRIVELEFYRKDGSTVWGEVTVSFMRDDTGQATGIIGVTRNITKRREAEQALRETEERSRKYLEIAGVMIVVLNPEGTITLVNKKASDVLGYSEDDLLGKEWFDVAIPENVRGEIKNIFGKIVNGEIEPYNYVENNVVTRSGELRLIAWNNTYMTDSEGTIIATVSSGEDITELKAAEEALRESEERLRTISEAVLEGIVITMKGVVIDANEQIAQVLRYRREEMIGRYVMDFVAPGSRELVMENIKNNIPESYEHMALRKDGTEVPVLISGIETILQGQSARITSIMDMTEVKRAEAVLREREKRYYLLYEDNPLPYHSLDEEGRILEVNEAWEKMLGYWRGDVIGTEFLEMVVEDYRDEILKAQATERISDEDVSFREFEIIRNDGTNMPVSVYSRSAEDEETKKVRKHCILIDITRRKQVEEDIKNQLEIKEVLLKEVHHRVKNNLQAISSILEIQSNMIEDHRAKKVLRDSQNRILSMALIHEKLYQMDDLHKIDLGDYISGLVKHLAYSHRINDDRVQISVSCEKIPINAETALACGLIVTELMLNSFKHAFPDGRPGTVSLDLKYNEEDYIVILQKDDGVGIPEDYMDKGQSSLGLNLVKSYVEHLSGTIEVLREKGTGYRITLREYEECSIEEL